MSYIEHLVAGQRPIGSSTEHYWRWPVMLRLRPLRQHGVSFLRVSAHGVRDGIVRGQGPFHPAVRSFLWIGPIGLEFGWMRQRIEDWRWRRSLRNAEGREDV